MLTRTTHLIYIAAIVLLVAALLRPSMQGAKQSDQDRPTEAARSIGQTSVRTPASAVASDDIELLQFTMLDAADAVDESPAYLAQRTAAVGEAQPTKLPQILDLPGDRLGSRSIKGSEQRLSPELIDRCLQVAREVDPDFGDKLTKLRKKDEPAFERIIQQRGGRLLAMAQLKQSEPDLYRTKVGELAQSVQVNRVAAQLRHARQSGDSPGQIQVLENQLRTLLQLQLAMSIKSRGDYLCTLEELIQKVRTEINSEAKHFPETVEGRMKHYLRQSGDEATSGSGGGDGSTSDASSEQEPGH